MEILKTRDNALDLMKTILTLQMITAHVVQFFPAGARTALFSDYVNLSTFSGFVFAFGFVCYKAYIVRECTIAHIMKGAIKTLLAFYISGVSYTFFIARDLTEASLIDILLIRRVPGYSEFLLSFVCIYLFVSVLKIFDTSMKYYNWIWLLVLVSISLGLTFIDYQLISNNIIGTIIGTCNYACFPILQYMSYFATGMYLAKFDKVFSPIIGICAMLGTGILMVYRQKNVYLPERFPPSIYWIIGGWGIVYAYYLISKYICKINKFTMPIWLLTVGKNTLVFLVMSNIVIFAFRYYLGEWYDNSILNYGWTILFYVGILMACVVAAYMMIGIKKQLKSR